MTSSEKRVSYEYSTKKKIKIKTTVKNIKIRNIEMHKGIKRNIITNLKKSRNGQV